MAPSHRPLRRKTALFAVALGCVVLAGCQSRGGLGDVTGSIGRSAEPTSAEGWRAESAEWGKRYETQPRDRTAAFRYARALRGLGQNAQAMAVLQQAVLVHQDDPELLGAYGRSLADNGRFKEADEVLARAHSPERPDWRLLSAQGTVADQLGEHPRAQQLYRTALKLAPGEPTILSNLGLSLALTRNLAEAETTLREAAGQPRADARVRQNLVLVLGLQGRFAEAEQVARQDQSPADAAATIAYLKRGVAQPNSWDKIKAAGGRPAPTGRIAPRSAESAPTG